jgi:hypothetical protein
LHGIDPSIEPSLKQALFLDRLEPMDKDGMYVVHDVVDDYPDLASTAIGDLEERHVVVYRVGHHPEGMRTRPLHPQTALYLLRLTYYIYFLDYAISEFCLEYIQSLVMQQ